ncbi:MAG: hypothetical protein H7839_06585 [Magnetococcus sp. YQC-5]
MSNSIYATPLYQPIQSFPKPVPVSQNASNAKSTVQQGVSFDQCLTQAEKDFIAAQLQQTKWAR